MCASWNSLHIYATDLARAQEIAFDPDHLQERFCRHHPIRIALDKLNADFRLALANGRSIPAELDEYATLLRLYKARKADQPIENSELDKLFPHSGGVQNLALRPLGGSAV